MRDKSPAPPVAPPAGRKLACGMVRRFAFLILLLALVLPLAWPKPVEATGPATPTQLWSHDDGYPWVNHAGWGSQAFASPAVGDLLGNGTMDVVSAYPDGYVWAWDSNGNFLWNHQTGAAIVGSPAIADMFNDGREEVVVTSEDGHVYMWYGDGSAVPGWPVDAGALGASLYHINDACIAGPAIGDVFGNGEKEVLASCDHFIYMYDAWGHVLSGWPNNESDTNVATPTLADLDGSGQLWTIIGGDSWKGNPEGAWYAIPPHGCPAGSVDGEILTEDLNPASWGGCEHPGQWPLLSNQVPWSSPVAVNAFENNPGSLSVFMGTGHNYCPSSGGNPAFTCGLYWDGRNPDGTYINSNWPYKTGAPNFSSMAAGDMGLGNQMEQLVGSSETNNTNNTDTYVLNADGTSVISPISGTVDIGSPAIGPVSNSTSNGFWVGNYGNVLGYDKNGVQQDVAPLPHLGGSLYPTMYSAPTIADLGNGHGPELIVTSMYGNGGSVPYIWSTTAYSIPSVGSGNISRSWPTFHGNMARNGGHVPVAAITTANNSTATYSDFDLNWGLATGSVPATSYNVWSQDVTAGGGWGIYTRTAAQSIHFYGTAGHQYHFYVDASNHLGSANLPKAGAYVTTVTAGSSPGPGLYYHSLAPYRALDTRTATCVQICTAAGPGTITNFKVAGYTPPGYAGSIVPATASAVVLNVTSVFGSAGTYLSVFPTGSPRPAASNVNAPSQDNVPNLVTVGVGTGGDVSIYNDSGTDNLIADVQGYYDSNGPSGEFHPLASPLRVCDTRGGQGTACNSGTDNPLGPGQTRLVNVWGGTGGIPTDHHATAAVMNLTGIFGSAGTYLTVFPASSGSCGAPPTASNLNLTAFSNQPNRVIVPLDVTTGDVCVYNAQGNINIAIDVTGWFGDGVDAGGTYFHVQQPGRVCDTRAIYGTQCQGLTQAANTMRPFIQLGYGGLPGSGPKALVLNITGVSPTQGTFLTIYPDGNTRPNTSDLNPAQWQNIANMDMVSLPGNGRLDVYNAVGNIDFIIDAVGWFS